MEKEVAISKKKKRKQRKIIIYRSKQSQAQEHFLKISSLKDPQSKVRSINKKELHFKKK
jgi:hypothetical protein